MRRWGALAIFPLLALVLFFGCAPERDFLDVFRGGYITEIEGTLYGMDFSATVEMDAEEEGKTTPVTVTFYAPTELAGTRITRDEGGKIEISSAGVTVSDGGGIGAALFSLFPTAGEVTESSLTDEGRTRVCGKGFVLEFLSDGTPYSVETEAVAATVVSWQKK